LNVETWSVFRTGRIFGGKEIGAFCPMHNGLFCTDPCWNLLVFETCKFCFLHPVYRLKIGIMKLIWCSKIFYGLCIIFVWPYSPRGEKEFIKVTHIIIVGKICSLSIK